MKPDNCLCSTRISRQLSEPGKGWVEASWRTSPAGKTSYGRCCRVNIDIPRL